MDKTADYITLEKKVALEKELEELKGPKRKEIINALDYAKSLGDLSENAEYHQAREDQGKLEEQIKKIEHILKVSKIAENLGGDIISIGSHVVVLKEDQKEKISYTIVGSEEADMSQGKVSNRSPFGSALFGKKKGDKVEFQTPKGLVHYKIVDVS